MDFLWRHHAIILRALQRGSQVSLVFEALVRERAPHVVQRPRHLRAGRLDAAVLRQPRNRDRERLRHVDEGRRHRTTEILREQHAPDRLPFFLRVFDVVAQAHRHVTQLTLALGDVADRAIHGAGVQAAGRQPGVGIHEGRQHAAHVLTETGDALTVNQALQSALVRLGALQVLLESRVPRLVAVTLQPQHVAEQFQALGRDAGEQLVILLAHGALRDGGALELGRQCHARPVRIPFAFVHSEEQTFAVLAHHIHGVFPEARQRHVASVHQVARLGGAIHHGVVQRHEAVALIRRRVGALANLGNQEFHGVAQGVLIQHAIPQAGEVLTQRAQHVGAGRHVDGAVNGRASFAVKADLVGRGVENRFQFFITPDHAGLEHCALKTGVDGLVELVFLHALPHAQHLGIKRAGAQHQVRLLVGRLVGVALLQVGHQHRLFLLVARPQQRALEQRLGDGLVVGRADRLLGKVAPRIHARQHARRAVGGVVRHQRHVINEALRGLEHRLEGRRALGQVAHGAHRLVPQGHGALCGERVRDALHGAVLELAHVGGAEEVVRLVAAEGQVPVLVLAGIAQLPQRRFKVIEGGPAIVGRQVDGALFEMDAAVHVGVIRHAHGNVDAVAPALVHVEILGADLVAVNRPALGGGQRLKRARLRANVA